MARDTVIRGVTFPGRIAWEGRFSRLLAAANTKATTPEIDAALEAIANGRPLALAPDSLMGAWTWITLRNLERYVRARATFLRRCRVCGRWFPASEARRILCRRAVCRKADARARMAKSRRIEIERQRAALQQVVQRRTR